MAATFYSLVSPFFIFFVFPNLSCSCPPAAVFPSCGNGSIEVRFPFYTNTTNPECRGHHMVFCDGSTPLIQFHGYERWYVLKTIDYTLRFTIVQDQEFGNGLRIPDCNLRYEFDPPIPLSENLFLPQFVSPNQSFFNCELSGYNSSADIFDEIYNRSLCKDYQLQFSDKLEDEGPDQAECWTSPNPLFEWQLSFGEDGDDLSLTYASYSHQRDGNLACFKHDTGTDSTCLCNNECETGEKGNLKRKLLIGSAAVTGGLLLACLLSFLYLYQHEKLPNSIFFWRKKSNNSQNIKAFLEGYGSLAPKKYSYKDVKRITRKFREKLGQGGYGTVFKGSFMDGRLVAVKILSDSKGDGEEFINEVASIGRTSHVNIVRLLGFCSEGSQRALIYEYMPNGSLDKYIYSETSILGLEILYQIAIGVAQGLEYLHRGCNTRIVHFDIKPHNILLDQEFCPKISDFGLAKLCPPKISILSMADPRGTIGFIAPEVFSRNFGVVSSKSDVYSYGMMVLEMVGGRKNLDVGAGKTSEIYFPHWIYKHIERDGDLHAYGATVETEEIVRKMILVGLWCIQTKPETRPSMSKVVDMLQGSLSDLQMPPTPVLTSPQVLSSPQGLLIDSSAETTP
ncbi:LEAF RUST 10 DISEASE-RESISTANCEUS RECEPTOR-LIKE PROTEIN KINASE-like 2.3 isoform X1 [Elaeis guineensis]|uniref:non-specific serine/threonine protein kinase n=1 Tax=Elaeis guineensis var. tenera TaxID=51953 RepID=A0A6J0PGV7_ELAGV|nr:LEAF RUST 10 DISEASE-RESISTANCE LOCUS RECEPTOR-LIKE PROTEIN KINASE-like 2.3 isoform X1 [Elaeis guineensis]